jgi:acetamidase/formamidase
MNPMQLLDVEIPRRVWICPIRDGKVYWTEDFPLPYQPMIGTIGTAPEVESTMEAGPHGGNMDLPDLTTGNTLYLPVFVEGALLHIGDAHAVQGDGELCGTAVEMPAEVSLTVGLIKNKTIGWPRIESADYIMAVGSRRPLEEAVRIAFRELIQWLHSEYGFDRMDAYNLCTQVARIRVGYYLTTIAAKFPKKNLTKNPRTKASYEV